jgi:hypothetical protein
MNATQRTVLAADTDHTDFPATEMTALLQDEVMRLEEEIARLQEELRLRDEILTEPIAAQQPPISAVPPADRMAADFNAELARRDETIELLLEQLRLFEEADAARQSEWEQLNQWITEVEERLAAREQDESLRGPLATAQQESIEAERVKAEMDRQAWEGERKTLERKCELLHAQVQAMSTTPSHALEGARTALEEENRQLRATCADLTRAAAATAEIDSVRAALQDTRADLDASTSEVRRLEDELEREHREHESLVACLRSELARQSLQMGVQTVQGRSNSTGDARSSLTVDERIRAFRLHLQDVHEKEQEERWKRSLSARLARLWTHTRPVV